MRPDDLSPFAAALAAARGTARWVPDPAHAPADLAQAYAAQFAVARALGAEVAGWKVGFSADATPVAAPMFRADFRPNGAGVALPVPGPVIVEAELAFRLASDLPPRERAYARDEILAAVDVALVGIELIAGRVGESKDVPFPVWLADNMGNAGYVTGAQVRDFAALDLAALRCTLQVDGRTVHDAVGGHPQRDPVEPLRAWASAQRDALGGLRAGQVVTTGSLTGATRLAEPATVEATLAGIGAVAVELIR